MPQTPIRGVSETQQRLTRLSLSDLPVLFDRAIPEELIATEGTQSKSRLRTFTPLVTFWAFLHQVFHPEGSCREAVRHLQVHKLLIDGYLSISSDTSAYCQARKRLPTRLFAQVFKHLWSLLEKTDEAVQPWCGRPVSIVDGTCLSMPDTPANQAVYPQSAEQKPGLGFPLLRLLVIFQLSTGAVQRWRSGNQHQGENGLLHWMLKTFKRGEVVLGDRIFCTYANMAWLLERGVDSVFRVNGRRRVDFRRGRRLSKNQRLAIWEKPSKRPDWMPDESWRVLPAQLSVRLVKVHVGAKGFRTRLIVLATTLLDPEIYSEEQLANLYFQRWRCELFLRDLKITLHMDILRCKSPRMVRKEIWMHLIAYNLIRWLLLESSAAHPEIPAARLSFKGALTALRQWLPMLSSLRKVSDIEIAFETLLTVLASDVVPQRTDRSEPRARKRRSKNFHLLTKPRHQMGNLPHRNRPDRKDLRYHG